MAKAKKAKTVKKPTSVKDLKPKRNAKGGIGLLLPAVQKIRD
jgi:hypothetical protein